MSKVVIKPFDTNTLPDVAALLAERNHTLATYVTWKYGNPIAGRLQGVVAYVEGKPVGCFGLLPRELRLTNGASISIGWFADWYVTPAQRGSGLGQLLLEAITAANPLTFGHPGTAAAQRLCAQFGYQPLPFQARRRLVLRPWLYEKLRTRFTVKAISKLLTRQTQTAWQRLSAESAYAEELASFSNPEVYGHWIFQQPVRPSIQRAYQTWQTQGLQVCYLDDHLPSGETRRRILFSQGAASLALDAWRAFVSSAKQVGCSYLEFFTTSRALDAIWQALGALPYADAPVMVKGSLPASLLLLHGWDRENWTFLADQVLAGPRTNPVCTSTIEESFITQA